MSLGSESLDISLEEAQAKIWIDDVEAELKAVEEILKSVRNALGDPAGSDDSIMNGIYTVAQAMENAWDKMCNTFKEAHDLTKQAVQKIFEKGLEVIDDAVTLGKAF